MDSIHTPSATPGDRPSTTTKSPWGRRAVRCLKATWWGYKFWEGGHKLVAYFLDPESWGGKALAYFLDPESWGGKALAFLSDLL